MQMDEVDSTSHLSTTDCRTDARGHVTSFRHSTGGPTASGVRRAPGQIMQNRNENLAPMPRESVTCCAKDEWGMSKKRGCSTRRTVKIPKLEYAHGGEAEEQIQQLSRLTLPWAILYLDIYPAIFILAQG